MIIGGMLYAYMFPPMLLAIPLLAIFARWQLADNLIGVIVAHCTMTIPLGVWLLWRQSEVSSAPVADRRLNEVYALEEGEVLRLVPSPARRPSLPSLTSGPSPRSTRCSIASTSQAFVVAVPATMASGTKAWSGVSMEAARGLRL